MAIASMRIRIEAVGRMGWWVVSGTAGWAEAGHPGVPLPLRTAIIDDGVVAVVFDIRGELVGVVSARVSWGRSGSPVRLTLFPTFP
jgi:hypothetical protein